MVVHLDDNVSSFAILRFLDDAAGATGWHTHLGDGFADLVFDRLRLQLGMEQLLVG